MMVHGRLRVSSAFCNVFCQPQYIVFSGEIEWVTGYQSIPESRLHLALPLYGFPNTSLTEQTYLPFTTLSSLGTNLTHTGKEGKGKCMKCRPRKRRRVTLIT